MTFHSNSISSCLRPSRYCKWKSTTVTSILGVTSFNMIQIHDNINVGNYVVIVQIFVLLLRLGIIKAGNLNEKHDHTLQQGVVI